VPATNVSNHIREKMRLPTVVPDDQLVGRMAAEYLLSLGFRDLAFCWEANTNYGELRLNAFRAHATENGATVHDYGGERKLGEWLVALPKPIGVLGCNDDYAHRVLNEARRQGIKVPDELAVLGVDDDELFNTLVTPSLSSIVLPAQQIGFEAAAKLEGLMKGERPQEMVTRLPPLRVVPRESTDVLSIPDPDVVQALRFIRAHASRPIQVDDVLDNLTLSRRSLERKFRRLMGHSVSDEIRRAHLERAKQLMVQTDFAMSQVAAASGFTTATRLGIVFRRELKETPTAFRRRVRAARKPQRK
jgi:LacI family transcriptional regulator